MLATVVELGAMQRTISYILVYWGSSHIKQLRAFALNISSDSEKHTDWTAGGRQQLKATMGQLTVSKKQNSAFDLSVHLYWKMKIEQITYWSQHYIQIFNFQYFFTPESKLTYKLIFQKAYFLHSITLLLLTLTIL